MPQTHLDKWQIIPKTQEIDVKAERTKCRTRERKEAISWKVRGVEMGFQGEKISIAVEGRDP